MMNRKAILLLAAACGLFCACAPKNLKPLSVQTVQEDWFTESLPSQNIDSPAAWHSADDRHWLFATAKAADCVNVYDALTGAPIRSIGSTGNQPGQMSRPNGIWVQDELLFVVERDNARVQVFHLPELNPVGSFGESELTKPYGLCVVPFGGGVYSVYVTDNYETAAGNQVPVEEMDHRVREYRVEVKDGKLASSLANTFGETSGAGILFVVESVLADTSRNRLLVSDEDMETPGAHNVKFYAPDGTFTGKTLADGLYRNQAEGLALLYANPSEKRWQDAGIAGRTYFFLTDQGMQENYYHIFDADSLAYLGSIELAVTRNTDGVWLDPTATERFPLGVFYAVDDDCRVAATDLRKFLEVLRRTSAPTPVK